MEVEREILEADILVIGAGPAGLSFAYHLAKLVENSGGKVAKPEIIVVEKGSYPGAHSLSGAILDPRTLNEMIPDYANRNFPYEKKAGRDTLRFLTDKSAFKLPFTPKPFANDGNYIVSLNKFVVWLTEQVEACEIDIFPETG
jgi:electron-transferring-flavoprotein dehydrogenase